MIRFLKSIVNFFSETSKLQQELGIFTFHTPVGTYTYYDAEVMQIYIKKMKEEQNETS